MIILSAQSARWDETQYFSYSSNHQPIKQDDFKIGEQIIVKDETGTYLMMIIDIQEREDKQLIEENNYV